MKQHKHKGVLNSNGGLRLHPVDRMHKDTYAKRCHTLALANEVKLKKTMTKPKSVKKETIKSKIDSVKKIFGNKPITQNSKSNNAMCQIDDEGYITMNLDKLPAKGVRFSFIRRENGINKTVGLQIDKDPCKLHNGEFIQTHTGKLVLDKSVLF